MFLFKNKHDFFNLLFLVHCERNKLVPEIANGQKNSKNYLDLV